MTDVATQPIPDRTAREVMIPLDSYPHVSEAASLAEAISVFTGSTIERKGKLSLPRVLLVFNDQDELVGTVRRRDIMRGLLPRFMTRKEQRHAEAHFEIDEMDDLHLADLFKDTKHTLLSKNSQAPVSIVMRAIEKTVEADAELIELVRQMVTNEFHFLPVMENGHVIGVVRTVEILNQIRRLLES